MTDETKIIPGIYQHFRGRCYDVLGVSVYHDTGEQIVVYRKTYGEDRSWEHRPLSVFTEHIERDDYSGPRFALVYSNQTGPLD